jgi:hypothetical protein
VVEAVAIAEVGIKIGTIAKVVVGMKVVVVVKVVVGMEITGRVVPGVKRNDF